jgi:hypothetical protein
MLTLIISLSECHPERSAAESKDLLFADAGAKDDTIAAVGTEKDVKPPDLCKTMNEPSNHHKQNLLLGKNKPAQNGMTAPPNPVK